MFTRAVAGVHATPTARNGEICVESKATQLDKRKKRKRNRKRQMHMADEEVLVCRFYLALFFFLFFFAFVLVHLGHAWDDPRSHLTHQLSQCGSSIKADRALRCGRRSQAGRTVNAPEHAMNKSMCTSSAAFLLISNVYERMCGSIWQRGHLFVFSDSDTNKYAQQENKKNELWRFAWVWVQALTLSSFVRWISCVSISLVQCNHLCVSWMNTLHK